MKGEFLFSCCLECINRTANTRVSYPDNLVRNFQKFPKVNNITNNILHSLHAQKIWLAEKENKRKI